MMTSMLDFRYWRCVMKREWKCPDSEINFFLYTPWVSNNFLFYLPMVLKIIIIMFAPTPNTPKLSIDFCDLNVCIVFTKNTHNSLFGLSNFSALEPWARLFREILTLPGLHCHCVCPKKLCNCTHLGIVYAMHAFVI